MTTTDDKIGTFEYKVSTAVISRGIEFVGEGTFNSYINFTPHVPTVLANGTNLVDRGSGYTQVGNNVYWQLDFDVTPTANTDEITFGNLPKAPSTGVQVYMSNGIFGINFATSNPITFIVTPLLSTTEFIGLTTIDGTLFGTGVTVRISGTVEYMI